MLLNMLDYPVKRILHGLQQMLDYRHRQSAVNIFIFVVTLNIHLTNCRLKQALPRSYLGERGSEREVQIRQNDSEGGDMRACRRRQSESQVAF